jgi:hypothetical protein
MAITGETQVAPLKSKINAYNVFILLFVGLGSITYGYTASIIATTLGELLTNNDSAGVHY